MDNEYENYQESLNKENNVTKENCKESCLSPNCKYNCQKFAIDTKEVDNVEFDGVDFKDYPDFCDAFISSADYKGVPMTDEQLEEINDDTEFVYECLQNQLY